MKKVLSIVMALAMLITLAPVAMAETTEEREPVTITFGGWGDIALLRAQCKAFEEKYPWITVEVVKPAGVDWYADTLTQLAAENNMPDVFNIENPLQAYSNGWCYDLTDLFLDDPDSVVYPEEYLKYGVVNNQLIGVIGAMYAYGIELNLTLLEELNIPIPEYNWTVDEFADILRKTCVADTSWGTIDLNEMLWYILPQYDENVTAGGLDPDTMTFVDNDAMVECFSLFESLMQEDVSINGYFARHIDYSWTTDEGNIQKQNDWLMETLGATDNLWLRGKIAMRMRPSWNLTWMANAEASGVYSGFEYAWYPFPSAVEGQQSRTALLNEFLSVSSTTEHPYESYLLLKYMSFDMDGYEAKIDFMADYDYDKVVADNPDLDTKYINQRLLIWLLGASTEERADEIFAKLNPEEYGLGGLAAAFANRNNNAYLLPDRWLPGVWTCYDNVNWWLVNGFGQGLVDPAWVSAENGNANTKAVQEAWESYGNLTYGWTEEFLASRNADK